MVTCTSSNLPMLDIEAAGYDAGVRTLEDSVFGTSLAGRCWRLQSRHGPSYWAATTHPPFAGHMGVGPPWL
jgi:hypothetical protein